MVEVRMPPHLVVICENCGNRHNIIDAVFYPDLFCAKCNFEGDPELPRLKFTKEQEDFLRPYFPKENPLFKLEKELNRRTNEALAEDRRAFEESVKKAKETK